MIKAGIIGATGYTGFEILKILLGHPGCEVVWLTARKIEKPEPITSIFPHLNKKCDLICQNEIDVSAIAKAVDVVFLSLPHRVSMTVAKEFLDAGVKVIDMSGDFRIKDKDVFEKAYGVPHACPGILSQAVYGLPEWDRKNIKKTNLISNPGCYPTSVLLGLLPLLNAGKFDCSGKIICDSKSGVSGAGKTLSPATHFSECNETMKAYKVLKHQHQPEIEQLAGIVAGHDMYCVFVPHLIPITRGILSTLYVPLTKNIDGQKLADIYSKYYKDEPFVRVLKHGEMPEVRYVTNTNFCDIGVASDGKLAVIVSVIDNLVKGAAGQAVQNMNIMFGLDEKAGLI